MHSFVFIRCFYLGYVEHAFVKASPFIDLLKCEHSVKKDETSAYTTYILFLLQSLPKFYVKESLIQNSPPESKPTHWGKRVLEKQVVK
jgi:hypothetical protein